MKTVLKNGPISQNETAPQDDTKVDHIQDVGPPKQQVLEILSVPIPPDGGYGWVICACAFLVMLMLDGVLFSFGVLFLDLLDYFKESKSKTAWVGSTLMGTHLLVGPVTSALVNAWGIRPVAIAGACLASVSFMVSALAPSVDVLIFTYGIMGGIGISMAYIPSIFIVGFYFEKRRALANGIANSGSGVGTFVFAPLCEFLQDKYGWRGALLIISGLVFNCLVFVSLFRPLKQRKIRRKVYFSPVNVSQRDSDAFTDKESGQDHSITFGNGNLPHQKEVVHDSNPIFDSVLHDSNLMKTKHGNVRFGERSMGRIFRSRTMEWQPKMFFGSTLSVDDMKLRRKLRCQKYSKYSMINVNSLNDSATSLRPKRHLTVDMLNKPLLRKDIFYSGSIMKINTSHENIVNIESLYHDLDKIKEYKCEQDDLTPQGKDYKADICIGLKLVAGFSILKNPVFLLAVLMSILWTASAVVLTILPNQATLCGISSRDASLLVSIIGVFNIIGRVFSGWLADRFNCIVINATALFVGGLVNFMIPFTVNYHMLCAQSAIFGLGMGSWTSLRPIVLVKILGIANLTNAFGVLAMFQGAAFCVGSPVAGLFYDFTKSYKLPFIVAGCAFFTASLLCIPLYILGRRRRRIPYNDDIILREISTEI